MTFTFVLPTVQAYNNVRASAFTGKTDADPATFLLPPVIAGVPLVLPTSGNVTLTPDSADQVNISTISLKSNKETIAKSSKYVIKATVTTNTDFDEASFSVPVSGQTDQFTAFDNISVQVEGKVFAGTDVTTLSPLFVTAATLPGTTKVIVRFAGHQASGNTYSITVRYTVSSST